MDVNRILPVKTHEELEYDNWIRSVEIGFMEMLDKGVSDKELKEFFIKAFDKCPLTVDNVKMSLIYNMCLLVMTEKLNIARYDASVKIKPYK